MKYQQLSGEERFLIAARRSHGLSFAEISGVLGRHRTTLWREVGRNCAPYDGGYRSARAHERAGARRKLSRRNQQFGEEHLARVEALLAQKWSPEQISGHLRRTGEFSIEPRDHLPAHLERSSARGAFASAFALGA